MYVVIRTIKAKRYALCMDSSKHKIGLHFDVPTSPDVRKYPTHDAAAKAAKAMGGTAEPA